MEDKETQSIRTFPEGFLWGAGSSAFQVEGGIENTDWFEAGRAGLVPPQGLACDHYRRYEEDFDIAKSLSHNASRISIEWARIEPEEGKFNENEIAHYRDVLRALRARGLEPVVTLWHFSLPLWFSSRGGFLHKNAPEVFARYCEFVVSRLGGEAEFWNPINEPEIFANNGYVRGIWPPFFKHRIFTALSVGRALARAHILAYKKMRAQNAQIKIGVNKDNIFYEANWNPLNKLGKVFINWMWNYWFLDATKGSYDFIGLNHYFHVKLGMSKREWADAPRNDMGWELHPDSLYQTLVGLKPYGVPVYVTENGIPDKTDTKRAQFIRDALSQVARAIKVGVDIRGYFYWSLTDNYELAQGFTQRFGLIEINYETLERTVRPSARMYAEICKNNAL